MKTKGKKLLAIVLTISLCMGNMITVSADEETKHVDSMDAIESIDGLDWNTATEEDCDVKIQYQITSHWDNHYNVDVILENMTDERIDNWTICIPANYRIENIWNAKVTDDTDGEYTIHNAEWNQDIAVGGSVSFGMTVSCSGELGIPEYVYTLGLSKRLNESEYKIEFKKHSQWDGRFNGQIIITNLSDKPIEDWHMSFDCNFEIDQIWNAAIAEEIWEEDINYYVLENPGYHQNIAPNQSVEFGFIAAGDKEPELSRMELYKVTSDFEFSDEEDDEDENKDELKFVDEFRLDSDYFETREEYEQYLDEHGYTDDDLMDLDEPAESSRARKKSKKSEKVVPCKAEDIGIDQLASPIQHYMPLPKGASYLMSASGKNAQVIKRTVDSNGNPAFADPVTFKGFGHGQTFEQFILSNNQEYYLLGGDVKDKFSRSLALVPRSLFENRMLNSESLHFSDWEEGLFRIMTNLEGANKKGSIRGDLHRVDAALTSDGSTLVIWKEIQNKNETIHEISLYKMRKILKVYKNQKKEESKKKKSKKKQMSKNLELSFTGDYAENLKKACIGSFWEKYPGEEKSVLKPNSSFQSIDIEKYFENNKEKWRIAITSGNEIGELKDATITRLEVQKSKKKSTTETGVTYKAYRDDVVLEGNTKARLELEGGHFMNASRFEFIAMKKTGETKVKGKIKKLRKQYFATVDLLDITTRIR